MGKRMTNTVNEERSRALMKVTLSGWMGTTLEYVDFQLYGLAAALVFNVIFFPDVSPAVGLMASMATYGVGYFSRILGAYVFGRLGDRIGRKHVLIMTIVLMGGGSTLIGILPTYGMIGLWAPFLLLILRLIQGFGAGAEISGATVMLTEHAPTKRRGILTSFVALGTNSGTLLASAIWLILTLVLSNDQLVSWGWRIPFLCSALIMFFAVWIRKQVEETPVFLSREDVVDGKALSSAEFKKLAASSENKDLFETNNKRKGKAFFLALGLRIGQSGNSSIIQTFLVGYLVTTLLVNKSITSMTLVYGSLLGFLTIPFIGFLGDRFGRRKIYCAVTILSIIAAWPLMLLIVSGETWGVILGIVLALNICVLHLFSLENAAMTELFGSRNRYTQLALSKEFGGILPAGLAPFAASGFCALAGSWWPIPVMLILFSAITLISAWASPEIAGRDLNEFKDAV
ncbi:MAG: MFS transporter [Sporolactobacillus sp.]